MSEKEFTADPLMWGADTVTEPDIAWYNIKQAPFQIYGLSYDSQSDRFYRLPKTIAENISQGVAELYANTSGGRVRFATDSDCVILRATLPSVTHFDHMPMTGVCGFDLYEDDPSTEQSFYLHTFRPSPDMTAGFVSVVRFKEKKLRYLTVNFPLYNEVCEVEIGLKNNAALQAGMPYRNQEPVVFYGSSITQGGCASRPGNCYASALCRAFNLDYVNLGFSGSGKAEDSMVAYMAELPMSLFVCDYDHNAPHADYLRATHEKMYLTIRAKHPSIPYIMMTHPEYSTLCPGNNQSEERKAIIAQTYENAKQSGDRNVYFLDGGTCFPNGVGEACTVDKTHPNDLGFYFMAEGLKSILKQIL